VTFNASKSYDGDGYIVSYAWDFGDETPIITEEDPITTHIYTQAGNYTATLIVTDNDGLTNSTTKEITVLPYKLAIDLYTQKEPYSGKGYNQTSDAFAPGDLVNLTAYLTYNDEPAPNKIVSFEVIDPNNTTIFLGTSNTTENGLAKTSFMLLTNATFGTYTAIAKGEIAEKTCNDTLTFKVGWIIEITKVETMDQYGNPKNNFTRGEQLYFNINLKNIAFTPKNVTLTVTIQDNANQPIGVANIWIEIRPDHRELKLVFNVVTPEWCVVGSAAAYACAFTNWPWLGRVPYCPEMSTSIYIKAG
jgi:PKD repeat protein